PATIRFERANDLHCTNLRRARDGPRWKARSQRIEAIQTITQTRTQHSLQMLHVRIALDSHQIVDLHRSIIRNTSKIVSTEIDEHHMFGNLFFVRLQILTQQQIFRLSRAAFSRAGNRAIVEPLPMTTNEHLRRRTHDGLITHSQKEHVWRRIDRAQRSINLKWIAVELCRESLRQYHLVTVAGGDVLFHLPHAFFEPSSRPV